MAGEVVAPAVVGEAVRSCFDMLGRYISFTRKYKKNINILQRELKKLEANKETILNDVQIAKRNAQDIRPDVLRWQQTCDELETKANELLQTSRPFNMSCLCCSCPNIKSRYQSSTEAAKLTSSITQHLEEGRFERVGQQPQLGQLPLLSPGEYHGFGSRTIIKKEVIDGLKNDSITIIGLSGMGGVGKTTLVKKIAEEVKNEKLFDEFAFVVVSQVVNIKVIQDELAYRLGLEDIKNVMIIHRRAELLYKRLMDEKKKILVILDDIWQELNLRSIGIPVHGDRKGFKILMTSRNDRVYTDMEVQKRLMVGILSKDEAWNLFMITAKISDEAIKGIAKEVSQECAGLPLAIVIVGKSLRGKKEGSFRDVLRTLRDPSSSSNTSGVHGVLYSCIKSSYDDLKNDEYRSLLLLCSLFPEDFNICIEDLVRYSRGLSDSIKSMEEARDRVEDIVDELMERFLMLPGTNKKCVTLHDVVRDVCILMTKESGVVNIFSKFDDLLKKLSGLKPLSLRLLRLVNEESFGDLGLIEKENKEIKFSEEMQEVRVLEVNHSTISLPTSLQFMFNLQTLALDYCRLKGDFAGLGSLKMLKVLSFFKSIIEKFPMEIAELTNLQCLDLRCHFNVPTTLPFGMLSSLNQLEELYMGHHISGNTEILKELCSLSKLHTFQCVVDKDDSSLDLLLRNLNLSELTRFNINWGRSEIIEYQIIENVLHLTGKISDMNIYLLKRLMRRVNSFKLNGEGLANVVDVSGDDNGFLNLKYLELHKCDMKYLVDANNHLPNGVLGKLEELRIRDANQLEELIHGIHQFETNCRGNLNVRGIFQCPLGNLSILIISNSYKLRSLFSKSIVNCLRNLKRIRVHSCPLFERIVTSMDDEQMDCLEVELSQLPEFTSFGPKPSMMSGFNQMIPELETLEIELFDSVKGIEGETEQKELCFYLGCSLPKLRLLEIKECNNLVSIAKSGLLHGFQKLEELKVWECSSLQVVFDFEVIISSAEYEETSFLGRLEILDLKSLPKLKYIWRMLPKETPIFRNLKKIEVEKCGSLRYLLTPTVASMLGNLEEIMLEENELMEAIIGMDEDDMPNDGHEFPLGRIVVLPKLESLTVKELPMLRKFCCCSPDLVLHLPSLSYLWVSDCFSLEFIFDETMSQLEKLNLYSLPNLKHIWRMLPKKTVAFQNLKRIDLKKCGSLRYLLTSTIANMLVNLEEIKLENNELMEAIIGMEENYISNDGDVFGMGRIVLPKLKTLTVWKLPRFRNLCCCSPDLVLELPLLTSLSLSGIGVGRYPLTPSLVELLPNIKELKLSNDVLTEAIIGSEKSEATKGYVVLPELQKMEISGLSNLRKLCFSPDLTLGLSSLKELRISKSAVDILTIETHALQNLTKVVIEYCGSFKYLLTSSAQLLVHLEEMYIYISKSMEAIFGYESSDGEEIPNNTIVLPKLRQLHICWTSSFRMICCSSNINVELPSLTQLYFNVCPNMSKLCAGQLSTPQLTHVTYGSKEIDLGTFINSWLKDRESMIRCLNCSSDRSETCDHLEDQRKEREVIEESSNAIGD